MSEIGKQDLEGYFCTVSDEVINKLSNYRKYYSINGVKSFIIVKQGKLVFTSFAEAQYFKPMYLSPQNKFIKGWLTKEEHQLDGVESIADMICQPKSELDLMKEKEATGDYVFYVELTELKGIHLAKKPFNAMSIVKNIYPIHNKDALIAQAVAKDSSVSVELSSGIQGGTDTFPLPTKVNNFFEGYQETYKYRLKQPSPQPVAKESLTTESTIGKSPTVETISIKDGKAEHFAKFGFEVPNFECEIAGAKGEKMIGWVSNNDKPMVWWVETGKTLDCYTNFYDLTKVKKQWYEDESNFPARVVGISGISNGILYNVECIDSKNLLHVEHSAKLLHVENVRLATKAERDSLYVKGDTDGHESFWPAS